MRSGSDNGTMIPATMTVHPRVCQSVPPRMLYRTPPYTLVYLGICSTMTGGYVRADQGSTFRQTHKRQLTKKQLNKKQRIRSFRRAPPLWIKDNMRMRPAQRRT